jgi:hypothetical protein
MTRTSTEADQAAPSAATLLDGRTKAEVCESPKEAGENDDVVIASWLYENRANPLIEGRGLDEQRRVPDR